MFLKHKTIRWILFAVLVLIVLYTGISCVATFCKAATQPYLSSGTETHYFLGYYMMAAGNGAVCAICTVLAVWLLVGGKRKTAPVGSAGEKAVSLTGTSL